jgi:hypothetical protein
MIAAAIPSVIGSPTTSTARAVFATRVQFTTRHVIAVMAIPLMEAATSHPATVTAVVNHLLEVEDFTSHLADDGAM